MSTWKRRSATLPFAELSVHAAVNVVQAGVSTDADTNFMEANRAPVPSGLFLLDVPHKAWIQRPRGSNQPYVPKPAMRYRGDLNDGAAFEKWRTGYSSALAIILFVTVFGAANIYVKALNKVKQR